MNDIIPGCPFAFKTKWLVYFLSGLIGYIIVTYIIKGKQPEKEKILNNLITSIIVYLSVWKLSYMLFHPLRVFDFPLSIIYFNGGIKGKWLAGIVVTLYLVFHANKNRAFIGSYIKSVTAAFISVMSVYFFMKAIVEHRDYFIFLMIFVIGVVMIWLAFKNRNQTSVTLFVHLLMWFSLLSTGLLFFEKNYQRLLGFTNVQWFFLIVGIISFVFSAIKRDSFIDS